MPARTDPLKAMTAITLGESGYTNEYIANELDLPRGTVSDIVRGYRNWGKIAAAPVFSRLRQEQTRILEASARLMTADFWAQAHRDREKMSPYQAVVAGSILIDKAQLLAGLPTEISANLNVSGIDALEKLAEKLDELRQTKDSGGNSGGTNHQGPDNKSIKSDR